MTTRIGSWLIAGLALAAPALANDWVTEGRLVSVEEEIERVEKITKEDVMRALHQFPMRDKQVLTTLGPLGEAELLA